MEDIIYWAIAINFIWMVIITILVARMIKRYKIENSLSKKGDKRDAMCEILMKENERLMDMFLDFAKVISKR